VWVRSSLILIFFIFSIQYVTQDVAKAESLSFMLEGRQRQSQVFKGGDSLRFFAYIPSLREIEIMFTAAAEEYYGRDQIFYLAFERLHWQYVMFQGGYVGLVASIPLSWSDQQSLCYIYSRFYATKNSWYFNNYHCKEPTQNDESQGSQL
jgi:hypothetical protein